MKGKIILVSGVSGSGKSTLVRELCETSSELYYRIALDDFYNMLPLGNKDLWSPFYVEETVQMMFHMTKYLIANGKNVIIDMILLGKENHRRIVEDLKSKFKDENIVLIKLNCNIDELRRRTLKRGDRDFNEVQRQYIMNLADECFDLVLNTSEMSLEENLKKVQAYIKENNQGKKIRDISIDL